MESLDKEEVKIQLQNGTFSRTAVETHMVLIGKILFTLLSPGSIGNTGSGKLTDMNPLMLTAQLSIVGPFFEELMFRFFPYYVFGESWKVGVVSSAIFAAIHNLGDFSKIPATQFFGGIYYWYLLLVFNT